MFLEGVVCLKFAAGSWKKRWHTDNIWNVFFFCSFSNDTISWSIPLIVHYSESNQKIKHWLNVFFLPVLFLFRWKQTQGTEVPSRLGLDLSGERILHCRRRRQVPGGGPQAERIPGRDVFHRLVLLCLFLFEWRPLSVCHVRPPWWDGAEHVVHTRDEKASICVPLQPQSSYILRCNTYSYSAVSQQRLYRPHRGCSGNARGFVHKLKMAHSDINEGHY